MSLALTQTTQDATDFDRALLGPAMNEIAGSGPLTLQPMAGGRNSRVYRVDHGDRKAAEAFVAKIYYNENLAIELAPDSKPMRDRCGNEFAALRFLWQNGIRCIPEPIATFPEQSVSILRLVEGSPLGRDDVAPRDIDALIEFLIQLDALKVRPASRALPDASEACFSLEAIAESIHARLVPLHAAADRGEGLAFQQLRGFLRDRVGPTFERALEVAVSLQTTRGLGVDSELPVENRTLSPSDVGFHNALRRPDGSLVFVDFEHFGWDDPAKMVSDFLLHPALPLSIDLRRRFRQRAIARHPACAAQDWRVAIVLPLYAIKWCTILLNEFVPAHAKRRVFASRESRAPRDHEALLSQQLAKAELMLKSANKA